MSSTTSGTMEPLMSIMQQYMMFKMAQSMGPFHPTSSSNMATLLQPSLPPAALPSSLTPLPQPLSTPITPTRNRAYSFLPDVTDQPSSPVEGTDIIEYIEWHIHSKKLTGSIKRGFLAAGNILEGQGYDLQTIQRRKTDEL